MSETVKSVATVNPLKIGGRWIGVIVFLIIGIVVMFGKPIAGLEPFGHNILGVILIMVGFWIFRPGGLPFAAGTVFMMALGAFFGLKQSVILTGFTSSSYWVLLPAMYFGFVLQKTGLGKRLAYMVLKSFKPSWTGLIISWLIIGLLLSLLTPSVLVRIAIVMPIAIGCIEACKFEARSREAALIALIAFGMSAIPGTMWLTGTLWGPVFSALFPPELRAMASFSEWFKVMSFPWAIATVVYIVGVYLAFKPKEKLDIPHDTFVKEHAGLGKMSRDELVTLVILGLSILIFFTEPFHKIPSAVTACAGLFLLMAFGLIKVPEIGTGLSWDFMLLAAVAMGLPAILGAAGIAKFIAGLLGPTFMSLAGSPLILLLGMLFILWAVRFLDVSMIASIAFTAPFLSPLYKAGIHPLVVTVVYIGVAQSFFMAYMSPILFAAETMTQGKAWNAQQVLKAAIVYAVAVIVAILVGMPYWRLIGVLS